jgi:hypothetical protein
MREGHALTLVGYQDDERAPGGGYFLVRNSWQPWAWEGVWQAGYGYIPYAYITGHASTIFSARRPPTQKPFIRGEAADGHPDLVGHSPDIWLRQNPDGGTTGQLPAPGRENALYVRVTNPGSVYRYGVSGEVYFRRAETGAWARACTFADRTLPPGQSVIGPMAWLPPPMEHVALAVRLL